MRIGHDRPFVYAGLINSDVRKEATDVVYPYSLDRREINLAMTSMAWLSRQREKGGGGLPCQCPPQNKRPPPPISNDKSQIPNNEVRWFQRSVSTGCLTSTPPSSTRCPGTASSHSNAHQT